MTTTDIVALLFLLVLTVNGAYQGFLRSLVKPAALLISCALSWTWYIATRHFDSAILIGLAGPFVISWLINFGLKRWVNADKLPDLSLLSRLGGQAVTLIWGSALITLTVACLSVLPFEKFELENMGKDVHRSQTLALIRPLLIGQGFLPATKIPAPCLNDVCKVDEQDQADLASDKEMQEMINDPHIQKILNDPATMAVIKSQDIRKILANPVINDLKSDPQFLLKVLRLYPKIQQKINAHESRSD